MAMKMSPNNQVEDNDNANVREATHSGTPKTETEAPEGTNSDAPAPNSAPRETDPDDDTYVYRDFATISAPSMDGVALHPQSLQAQKLPAKLASILSDQDLTSVIIWLPHGRSWRVLNRDLFAEHALPRYFGHKNYASFVRIINAWGFRRITRGADRDAYYHELFLRGRPDLHQRMKRLSNCHRKTPVHKEDKCPNFYELAKTSPLPEINLQSGGRASGGSINPETQIMPGISHGQMPQFSSLSQGNGVLGPNSVTFLGSLSLGGQMGNVNNNLYSHLLTSDNRSMGMGNVQQSLPTRLLQLQRDNEDLRRRIMAMENKRPQGSNQLGMNQHSMIPDQFGTMSANLGGGSIVKQELGRMQRDMMMQNPSNNMTNSPMVNSMSNLMNNPVNNSMNNSLLSSLGGSGSGGSSGNAHNYMSGFPRDEMLLRAMRLENQMGYQQQPSSSVMSQMEHNNLQQNNGGLSSNSGAASVQGCQDDRREAMMEWMEKQQQNDVPSI